MSAPRVLVCGTLLAQGLGGVQRHNRELLPRAARLLQAQGGALAVLLGREGLDFELPAAIARLPSNVPARPALARWSLESAALRRALDTARAAGAAFDLVHTAHLPAPHGLSVPFTLTLHDLKSVASVAQPLLRRVVGRHVIADAVARAARVLCVSGTLADEVRALTKCPDSKLAIVPNGCDHLPLVPRSQSDASFLLYVGRLEPRKNLAVLLRALASDPSLPQLWLAGESQGAHGAELEASARELGVERRVRFLGACDDARLAELYAACRCVVLPSLREGFDLPLVEALRAGAPVAASDLPVHRELSGAAARYFDPRSPEALAEAVRSASAATLAPALATWDQCAQACVAAWNDI